MYLTHQMFIIVVIIYSSYTVLANESNNCDCDVLQIEGPVGSFGNQNFTKQNDNHNGKPIYFSTKWNMIYWNEHDWSYEKYNGLLNKFEWTESYARKSFSFENMCRKKKTGRMTVRNDGSQLWKLDDNMLQNYYGNTLDMLDGEWNFKPKDDLIYIEKMSNSKVLETTDVNKVILEDFEEDKAEQLWKRGVPNAEGYFTLENHKVPKVMTRLYQGLEIKDRINVNVHSTKSFTSQCLRDNFSCFVTKKSTKNFADGRKVMLQAKKPCMFPFMYKNKTYESCTDKSDEKFWCGTTFYVTKSKTTWDYCSELCRKEKSTTLKDGEVAVKSWMIKLLVGILVSIILVIACIITYRYIKKKKGVAPDINDDYTLDPIINGNQARINSCMILNDQAEHLSYSGKHEIEESKFKIGKKIGGGSFGSVYEGTLAGQKMKVAVKSVKDSLDRSQVYALMCEIKVLDKLEKHLNLVNMVGACTAQNSTGKLWLLLEYCPCGDMKNFLNRNRDVLMQEHNQVPHKSINMRLFIKWGHGIAKGMEYLSSMKIMHGDLAARNILISNLDSDNYLAKITDFGLSKAFYEKTSYLKQIRRNVPWKWMDVNYLETGIFKMTSDVWSFGVVFWEMLSIGRIPYAGCNANDTIKEIKAGFRLPPPDEISQFQWLEKCYNEVTKMCWHSNPKQRSSFSNLAQTFETYLTAEEKEDYARMDQMYRQMINSVN